MNFPTVVYYYCLAYYNDNAGLFVFWACSVHPNPSNNVLVSLAPSSLDSRNSGVRLLRLVCKAVIYRSRLRSALFGDLHMPSSMYYYVYEVLV